ncbi:MAG: hypothetical protein MUE72_02235 [Chitinophagaceae bacterium]|nr:hypothetical protein [Chitinophagaceae bacterium]
MKQTVQKMQEAQQQQNQQPTNTQTQATPKATSNLKVDADYIEFEEIKEPK